MIKKIGLFLLVWIAFFLLVNKVSTIYLFDRTSYETPKNLEINSRFTILPWLNFDGRNYLDIANLGYFQKGEYNLRSFFPMYPILIDIVSKISGLNLIYSGILISLSSFFGSLVILYKIVKNKFSESVSLKTIIILLFFPTSFYFLSYYPESLFLFFSLATFYYLNKKDFLKSSIFSLFASATRLTGIILPIILLIEGFKSFKRYGKFPWAIILSPLGLVFYSLYSYIATGDPLIFFHSYTTWGKSFSLFGPIKSIVSGVSNLIRGPQTYFDSPYVYFITIIEIVSLIFVITILVKSYKKIKTSYWLYLLINTYFFLAGGILQSLPRYLLVMFPIYIYLALNLKSKTLIIYLGLSMLLLTMLSSLFLRGYWVS